MAAQGETVHQVLGSGDASQAHQRFPLHRGPLAIRPGVGPDGTGPDITVFVTPDATTQIHPRAQVPVMRSGPAVQWRRIDSLLAAGPDETVYMVQTDGAGATYVCFGDGVHGARLPSGRDNVTATYAIGAGAAGNVGAGAVSLVRSGPPGAVRVTNPLPADGGTLSEPASHIRVRAPRSLLALNRVVSLTDYQSYAQVFPGIGLCRGESIDTGSSRTLALSVTATDNTLPSDGLLADLRSAIVAARAGDAPFQILAYRPAPFHLHVHVTPDGSIDPAQVSASVRGALVKRLALRSAQFRRTVTAAAIVTAAESIAGVLDAEVLALYRAPGPVMREQVLRPQLAQWNTTAARIDAEELLYLELPDGLLIHMRSPS
jgi:predicted phage baseplate assembly protein